MASAVYVPGGIQNGHSRNVLSSHRSIRTAEWRERERALYDLSQTEKRRKFFPKLFTGSTT